MPPSSSLQLRRRSLRQLPFPDKVSSQVVPGVSSELLEARDRLRQVPPFASQRRWVYQAGHALFVDEPERFNQLAENFLEEGRGISGDVEGLRRIWYDLVHRLLL